MVNRLMRDRFIERNSADENPQPDVQVLNLTGIHQVHGLTAIPSDGQFHPVPYDLAKRLDGSEEYEVDMPGSRKIRPAVIGSKPAHGQDLDIVIPVHNQHQYLAKCIASIRANVRKCNIILVDDASDKPTKRWLRKHKPGTIIRHVRAKGFGRSCNVGIAKSVSPWVLVLNSDTIIAPHSISVMMSVGSLGFGIVGPTTSDSNGIQCDHTIAPKRHDMSFKEVFAIGEERVRRHLAEYAEADVFGFCMLISREVIDEIGGFDWVRYSDGYYEDWDYVWRARQAGFRSAWAKGAYVHHFGQKSFVDRIGWDRIRALSDRNEKIFEERKKDPTDLRFDMMKERRRANRSTRKPA